MITINNTDDGEVTETNIHQVINFKVNFTPLHWYIIMKAKNIDYHFNKYSGDIVDNWFNKKPLN